MYYLLRIALHFISRHTSKRPCISTRQFSFGSINFFSHKVLEVSFFLTINPMLSEIANNPRISNINNANSKTSERKTIAMWPKWKEESQYTSTEYPPRSPCEVPAALPSAGTVWFLVKTVYRVLVAPMALLSLWRCFAPRERRWQRREKPDTLSLGRLVTDCRRVFSCYWLDRTEMCLVHALISMVGHLK